MKVVVDASVPIFLAKIEKLGWLDELLKGPFYLPELIQQEILHGRALPPAESAGLNAYLPKWHIVKNRSKNFRAASAVSAADISVLQAASQVKAEIVLADEKLLRAILIARGHRVLGTLGVIALACRNHIASASEAKRLADLLIEKHRFRVGASTYRRFLEALKP